VAGLAAGDGGVVFAATPAGIRRSLDVGRTWTSPTARGGVPFANVVGSSGRSVFAGGREGAYRSVDGGTTWVQVLSGGNVLALAVISADEVFVGTESDGVLRSADGGRTWKSANPGLLDSTILALAMSPDFADDRVGFAATASGVYRTRNGGQSWRAVELGADEVAVQALAVLPHLVLAGTEADGLLRSDDTGDTWTSDAAFGTRGVAAVAYSANGTIAAATDAGVGLSLDGGATWRMTGAELGAVLSLAYVEGEVLLAGLTGQGVALSVDGGETWTPSSAGLEARLLVSLIVAGDVFVAGDLQAGITSSRDGGVSWQDVDDTPVFGLASAPGGSVFAASAAGVRRSTDRGATWHALPGAPTEPVRAVAAASRLVAAWPGGTVLASTDDGATWQPLGPSLAPAEVVGLAVADDGAVFAAAVEGATFTLWRMDAAGDRWRRWLVDQSAEVVALTVPPTHAVDGALFVGLNGRVLHPVRGTEEVRGGQRRPMWRAVTLGDGLARVTALVNSPSYAVDRTVYAGTSDGVFVSDDGGEHFRRCGDGLVPASILSLAYPEQGELYALALGGSVWRLGRS
jgi:photosystem II stability/assembly factor-like uncharacterized protein